MVDDRRQVVEERCPIAAPPRVVVGERALMPSLAGELLQDSEGRGEYDGSMAPPTEPPVPAEYARLKVVWQGGA
jgi:hypothetical protein